ncbi:MAG: hypothetical protein RL026_2180 [Pseudomonadota bacterium]|jgi:sodium transport system permease protein
MILRGAGIVFLKEFVENLRDRRTVFAALVFGPLLAPLLFGLTLQYSIRENVADPAEALVVAQGGPGEAGNLRDFLEGRGIQTTPFPGDEAAARDAVLERRQPLVLWIPADHGLRLGQGRPAPVQLFFDASDREQQRKVDRLQGALGDYARQLASQRLSLRGIDPALLAPVPVQEVDVSTPASRAALALAMLDFFLILALMSGGLYLAIDTTAGERERGTLEALLTLPVSRDALLVGKLCATAAYMMMSLVLTATAFVLVMSQVELERLGMSAALGPGTVLAVVGVTAPLVPAGAALMTLVASFARSVREAQAWLGALQLLPSLPLVLATLSNLAPTPWLLLVPSLSQHFLVTRILRAEPVAGLDLALSAGGSLALGGLLAWACLRVYRREALLA